MDAVQNSATLLDQLIVPESQHAKALLVQPGTSLRIVVFLRRMLTAIKLDDEVRGQANEVNDVGSESMLTTKLEQFEATRSKLAPQHAFDVRALDSKRAGLGDESSVGHGCGGGK